MAQSKQGSNSIREMLTHQGNIKPSALPTPVRTMNKAESQAAAIAARRAELMRGIPVVTLNNSSVQK